MELVGLDGYQARGLEQDELALLEAAAEALGVGRVHRVVVAREPGQHDARGRRAEGGLVADERGAIRFSEQDVLLEADVVVEVPGPEGKFQLVVEEAPADFAEHGVGLRRVVLVHGRRDEVAKRLVAVVARVAVEGAEGPPPRTLQPRVKRQFLAHHA